MVTVRKRNVKVFTFAFVLITVTSFLLNYKHQVTMTTWDPKHIISQFSEQVRKLINFLGGRAAVAPVFPSWDIPSGSTRGLTQLCNLS